MKVQVLEPTRMYGARYRVDDHIIVGFTFHALRQAQHRGIAPVEILSSVAGLPMALWKIKGVAAKKTGQFIKVFTVWKPRGDQLIIPF